MGLFTTLKRKLLPNPLDQIIKRVSKNGQKRFLIFWNRGLGDIALGLYAIVQRIKTTIPDAEITFLIRKNLEQGFCLLQGVKVRIAPHWERGKKTEGKNELVHLGIDSKDFDVIIDDPDPTYWVKWQLGHVVPRLKWDQKFESVKILNQLKGEGYIGVQPSAETSYGLWRNWPPHYWQLLFDQVKDKKFILFGYGKEVEYKGDNLIDLRGKTDLFEILTIIKSKLSYLILPDSGVLSMTYYLDENFPIKVISLFADPRHGIIKQNVLSPNPSLVHVPLIAKDRDLSKVTVEQVAELLRG